VGRGAGHGPRAGRPGAAGVPVRPGHHRHLPGAARARRRSGRPGGPARRRDRGPGRAGVARVRGAPAARSRDLGGRGAAARRPAPGHLPGVRPAPPGWPGAAGRPLPGPAGAAGVAPAARPALADPARVHRRASRGGAGRVPPARPGGDRGQAAGLPVRAGAPHRQLDQDQKRAPAGGGGRWLAAGPGEPGGPDRVAAGRRRRAGWPALRRPCRDRVHPPRAADAHRAAGATAPGLAPVRGAGAARARPGRGLGGTGAGGGGGLRGLDPGRPYARSLLPGPSAGQGPGRGGPRVTGGQRAPRRPAAPGGAARSSPAPARRARSGTG
jgi:hypothetical protein